MEALMAARICALTPRLARLTGQFLQPSHFLHEVQQEIACRDERLRSLNEELGSLLSLRNSVEPINKLPNNLLVEIFSCLHNDSPLVYENTDFNAATSVCKHWRTVALSAPKFWTTFYLRQPDFTAEYLPRSGALPLSIYLDRNHEGSITETGQILASHMHRVQSLFVDLTSIRELRALLKTLNVPAPRLEDLQLEYDSGEYSPSGMVKFPSVFGGSLPTLRLLSLHDVVLPSIPSLPKLRVLELHGWTPSAAYVLEYLERSPLLETVILSALSFAEDVAMDSRVVSLPHLTDLRLESLDPPECHALLSHMALPETVKIHLHMDTKRRGPMFPRDPISISNLKCFSTPELLELRCIEPMYYTIRAFCERDPTQDSDARLFAEAWEHDLPLYNWLPSLPQLKTFVLNGNCQSALYVDWVPFLAGLPQLETLRLLHPSNDVLLHVLHALLQGPGDVFEEDIDPQDAPVPPSQVDREKVCPRLSLLEIGNAQWDARALELLRDFASQRSLSGLARSHSGCSVNVFVSEHLWTEQDNAWVEDLGDLENVHVAWE